MIMEVLRNNQSIRKLDLSRCDFGDEGMKGIAKVLQSNHAARLRTLSICDNGYIGLEGFKALAIAFAQNSSLHDLNLSHCNLGDVGFIALMIGLSQNSFLRAINLEDCHIGDEGGKAVAKVLKCNTSSLFDLYLMGNDFGRESFIEIAEALHLNTHLKKLSLHHSLPSTMGIFWVAFNDALRHNFSLQEFCLYFDGEASNDYKISIDQSLAVNRKLGPVKAEIIKTDVFPRRIFPRLKTTSCFVEALCKVVSLGGLSPVFDLVREQPMLFDIDHSVPWRPTKEAKKKARME